MDVEPARARQERQQKQVDQTCRLQRRSLYGYLSDALAAKVRGDPVPTLA